MEVRSEMLDEKLEKLRSIFSMSCPPCLDDPKILTLIDPSIKFPSNELLDNVCSFLLSKIYILLNFHFTDILYTLDKILNILKRINFY